jgi:hypothetical protein
MHFAKGVLRRVGWALPGISTWLEEGIGLPQTFPNLMHMHFLEEMALLRWNGRVLTGYCLFFIASMVGYFFYSKNLNHTGYQY